jgi:hypothetical protein
MIIPLSLFGRTDRSASRPVSRRYRNAGQSNRISERDPSSILRFADDDGFAGNDAIDDRMCDFTAVFFRSPVTFHHFG